MKIINNETQKISIITLPVNREEPNADDHVIIEEGDSQEDIRSDSSNSSDSSRKKRKSKEHNKKVKL